MTETPLPVPRCRITRPGTGTPLEVQIDRVRGGIVAVTLPGDGGELPEAAWTLEIVQPGPAMRCQADVVWTHHTRSGQFRVGLGMVDVPDSLKRELASFKNDIPPQQFDLFREARLLESFQDSQLRLLCSICLQRSLAKRQMLFKAGRGSSVAKGLFFVERGLIRIFRERRGGDDQTLWTASAGEVFGEMSLFTGKPHSASIRAVNESTLMILHPAGLHFLQRHHPAVAIKLLEAVIQMLCNRLGRTTRLLFSPSSLR